MDVVWMAAFQSAHFLIENKKGQSLVEYVLLIAVITSIAFAFLHNRRFKDFMSGKNGYFATLREGMSYSYRYGREYSQDVDFDTAMNYNYGTNTHDTYLHSATMTRFFSSKEPYGE